MTTAATTDNHRWTRREYEHMVAGGVFDPEARLELIDGEIYDLSPQTSRHAPVIGLVEEALRAVFPRRYDVRVQLPIDVDSHSQPQPDVTVVEGSPRSFAERHPTSAVLIVEVADSSLAHDQTRKKASYARNGIPEYWILNLVDRVLEVYREPEGEDYRVCRRLDSSEKVSSGVLLDRTISVRDLLP